MKIFLMVAYSFLLTACAVAVTPQATGGSRADGVIEFSYTYGALQSPEPDWVTADQTAIQRCAVWGYSGAERFGGEQRQCNDAGCNVYLVTASYQCSGQPDAAR